MITEQKKQVLNHFDEGRRYYKLVEFEQARTCFARALKLDPKDGPSKIYFARCNHYIENPPPDDWDGVFVMQTK